MVMMQTTLVALATLLMYSTMEKAAELSRPVVGSSKNSTLGSPTRPMPMLTRFFCPLDSMLALSLAR